MSRFVSSPPLFHWMLDFSLAAWFQRVSLKDKFAQTALLPDFRLALVGCLVVQCLQIRLQESVFGLGMHLKFQMARYVS